MSASPVREHNIGSDDDFIVMKRGTLVEISNLLTKTVSYSVACMKGGDANATQADIDLAETVSKNINAEHGEWNSTISKCESSLF